MRLILITTRLKGRDVKSISALIPGGSIMPKTCAITATITKENKRKRQHVSIQTSRTTQTVCARTVILLSTTLSVRRRTYKRRWAK